MSSEMDDFLFFLLKNVLNCLGLNFIGVRDFEI